MLEGDLEARKDALLEHNSEYTVFVHDPIEGQDPPVHVSAETQHTIVF